MIEVLNVPGLYNSGPDHWQSWWERTRSDCRRIEQRDWDTPTRDDWVATLEAAVAARAAEGAPPPVLTAHSLGCATVAHWARATRQRIRGALLVAPSDVEAPSYPTGTTGFTPMPLAALPFPTIVVASSNDEYVTMARAAEFARAWNARLVNAGPLGHINSASALGDWPMGQRLLEELLAQ